MKDFIAFVFMPVLLLLAFLFAIVFGAIVVAISLIAAFGPLVVIVLFILYCIGFEVFNPLIISLVLTIAATFIMRLMRSNE
jgi:hypothetical protein